MDFSIKTKDRLAQYKATTFPNIGDGIWKRNKKTYSHILPEESKYDNLLPIFKDKLITYIGEQRVKLHPDFHHLNSSQAMCLNFFFPFYQENKLELITDFLGLKNDAVNYKSVCFEKVGLEAKFGRRATSFDFYFETTSGKKLYFEIKYTESKFGNGKINSDKFECVYSKYLNPLESSFHSSQSFYKNYQILRNLIHIAEDSYVVFIYPQDNSGIRSSADRVKREFLISNYHKHFFAVTWERLFESVLNWNDNTNIKLHLSEFSKKYL